MFKNIGIFIVIAFISLSCDSSTDLTHSDAPELIFAEPPLVTGITLTDETGTQRGYWGSPSGSGGKGLYIAPNPFSSMTTISFSVETDSRVRILMVRARLAGTQQNTSLGGAVISDSKDIIVAEYNYVIAAGQHSYTLKGTDKQGNLLPAGFYRVYLINGDKILWSDIYFSRTPDDLPPGMKFR